MIKFIKNFRKDEDGAVTVDWVVLTAAVVGLAIAAFTTLSDGAADIASTANTMIDTQATTTTATLSDYQD